MAGCDSLILHVHSPNHFRLGCCVRLGLPVPVPHWIRSCNCGDSLDDSGYHLITCKTGGGPVWTHDSVVSTWSDCLTSQERAMATI